MTGTASSSVDRDRSIIEVIASATNKRQAAKIRDVRSTRTLYFTQHDGLREYWVRGHQDGVYVFGKTNGAIHLARLTSPGRLSGMLAAATGVEVISDRSELPDGILRMYAANSGGDD